MAWHHEARAKQLWSMVAWAYVVYWQRLPAFRIAWSHTYPAHVVATWFTAIATQVRPPIYFFVCVQVQGDSTGSLAPGTEGFLPSGTATLGALRQHWDPCTSTEGFLHSGTATLGALRQHWEPCTSTEGFLHSGTATGGSTTALGAVHQQ